MPGKAAKVTITEQQQEILLRISRSRTEASHLRQRATIVLLAFEGQRNEVIANKVRLERHQVGLWRRRWADAFSKLVAIECGEGPRALQAAIVKLLSDVPRSGSPGIFSAEQLTQIIAVACESPADCGRAVTHWTPQELADEAVKRDIVPSITATTIRTLLHEADLKPHLSRYWLTSPDKKEDPEAFASRVQTVCDCYLNALELSFQFNTHTVSIDEMTGIQALERLNPTKPTQPGQVERREFEYKRHGTLTLIGNFNVVTGKLINPTFGPTRTEQDLAQHIDELVQTDNESCWVLIMDQLNVHWSESLVRLVARDEGIDETTLGKKGRSGVLKSKKTRQAFLEDASHRIRFVYTPRHTSWMNQIEIWFSILVRRVLKRGSFKSVAALRERIEAFIGYFNETMAKPFRWTYTGRPLQAKVA
jgi:transposase